MTFKAWWDSTVAWYEGLWTRVWTFLSQAYAVTHARNAILDANTQQDAENYYNGLPPEIQNDPTVISSLNTVKSWKPVSWDDFAQKAAGMVDVGKDALKSTYMKAEPVSVNSAFDVALNFVAFDMAKNISVGIAGLTAEVASVGQVDTFTDFYKFVAGKTGYGGVVTQVMKAPIEMTVIRPLSYWLHSQFRNELPEGKELVYAYWKGLLDTPGTLGAFNSDPLMAGYNVSNGRELIDRVLSFQGLPSWWTDIHIEGMYRAMNPRQLGDVLQDSTVDDVWLEKHIRAYGIDPQDVPVFKEAIKGRFFMGFMKAVAAKLGREYGDGYIDLTTYNTEMTALGFPPAVIDMERQVAKMQFDIELNKDLKAEWIAQYLHDIISEDDLRANLSNIIVSPRMVDAIVGLAKARYKPKKGTTAAGAKQGVKISSKPSWIPIFVDGVDSGKLTPETIPLAPGPHIVELRSPDYELDSHSLNVLAGEFIELHDVLKAVPTLFAIQLTPGTANVTIGGTVMFSTAGVDQYGNPYPLSSPISWSTISPSVATVDSSGNVTGRAVGTTYVQARSGFAFGQAAVTVT